MGLSIGGYYEGENGFYTNTHTGKKQDGSESAGGKLRWSWRPTDVVKLDWTASYEYSDEDACPYFLTQTQAGNSSTALPKEILEQNRPSSYRRHLFNTGLGVEHRLPHFVLSYGLPTSERPSLHDQDLRRQIFSP
ncbi:MAG: hypothetical protein ACLS29_01195 [Prevotellamassilia sp.]